MWCRVLCRSVFHAGCGVGHVQCRSVDCGGPSLRIRSVTDSSYSQNVGRVNNFGCPFLVHDVVNRV